MITLQPLQSIKTLFGFGKGKKPQQARPSALANHPSSLSMQDNGDPVVGWYQNQMKLSIDRFQMYKDADLCDADDIIVSVLDLYAEDATQQEVSTGRSIWFEAEDPEIHRLGNDMLDAIGAEEQVFSIARELAKYGDSFSGIIQSVKEDGMPGPIVGLLPASPYVISRVEDADGRLTGYKIGSIEQQSASVVSMPSGTSEDVDPPWSIVHFKLLGKNRTYSYGTSFLFGARRAYRRLRMVEDSMTIYRIKRAPDRLVIAIKGLGGMSPEERANAMRLIRQELRKKAGIDPATGQVKAEFDPLSIDEDLIVDAESVDIQRLTGSQQPGAVLDIEYLRKRFFGTLKIPPDYLGFSDAKSGFLTDTPLSLQDVNFARMEKRLQRAIMNGFGFLFQLHLCWCGIDPRSSRAKFKVCMAPISALDEKQRLEIDNIRAETISTLQRIGGELGIESDEWLAYILTRAQIPLHLLHSKEKETIGNLLKGKIEITESKKQHISTIIESASSEQQGKVAELIHQMKSAFLERRIGYTLSSNFLQAENNLIYEQVLNTLKEEVHKESITEQKSAQNIMTEVVNKLDEANRKHRASMLKKELEQMEDNNETEIN